MRETDLMRLIRRELNATGDVRLVRNSVGYDERNHVRYGLGVGSPDLIGTLRGGRCFAIEVKASKGRESPEQLAWWRAAAQWGILGGVARSLPEAQELLREALSRTK